MTSRPDQVRMIDLLRRDPDFRAFFIKPPKMPPHLEAKPHKPWRLMVQKHEGGPWQGKNFRTYRKAFETIKPYMSEAWDFAIISPGFSFRPPWIHVKVKRMIQHRGKEKLAVVVERRPFDRFPMTHAWCGYCRRPTVFWWFTKHHAFRGQPNVLRDPVQVSRVKRCIICGTNIELNLCYNMTQGRGLKKGQST